jgi:uncharacterized protein
MTTKQAIDQFFTQQSFAIVGVSRNPKKFGAAIFKEMKSKGLRVFPVNPTTDKIEGVTCYPSLSALPEHTGGAVFVTKPGATEAALREAKEVGIDNIWIQQGASSSEAIRFCEQNGVNVIHHECIMMYLEPVKSMHSFHRWVRGVFGRMPK